MICIELHRIASHLVHHSIYSSKHFANVHFHLVLDFSMTTSKLGVECLHRQCRYSAYNIHPHNTFIPICIATLVCQTGLRSNVTPIIFPFHVRKMQANILNHNINYSTDFIVFRHKLCVFWRIPHHFTVGLPFLFFRFVRIFFSIFIPLSSAPTIVLT